MSIANSVILNTLPNLNELQRRLFLGEVAISLGRGGITYLHNLTGHSMSMIRRGIKDVKNGVKYIPGQEMRRKGGGRKPLNQKYPDIEKNVQEIVDKSTYGDPENEITWTTESHRTITVKLKEIYKIEISYTSVGKLLKKIGYSKQKNQKKLQVGDPYPLRDEQFEYIYTVNREFMDEGCPVISIDTKKKEMVGNYKNEGSEYCVKNIPREVIDHDFPNGVLKIVPYGIYDLKNNHGFVNVGISHDTPELSYVSIKKWWFMEGHFMYPGAKKLLINADCGGSNGYRLNIWKFYLSKLANETKMDIYVSHLPPGTSKFNKIEHKFFCHISRNWSGKPLMNVETAVKYIAATKTTKGLTTTCVADYSQYDIGKKISKAQFNNIIIEHNDFCGELNYVIKYKR